MTNLNTCILNVNFLPCENIFGLDLFRNCFSEFILRFDKTHHTKFLFLLMHICYFVGFYLDALFVCDLIY